MLTDRILVVFTGGTIGSRVADGTIDVVGGQTHQLLHTYLGDKDAVLFDVIEPLNILSENAQPEDWATIARATVNALKDEHTGVIVTHGTDTLSFCSAALAFALADVGKPIVIVASNLPLDTAAANGPTNFRDAVEIIRCNDFKGVLVSYQNPDGRRIVHLGARILPATQLEHSFYSADSSHLGEFDASGVFQLQARKYAKEKSTSSFETPFEPAFCDDVLFIRPHPGLNYELINISNCRAVVHGTYHSGTASASPTPKQNVLKFGTRCKEAGIPIFCGPAPLDVGIYKSAQDFGPTGIIQFTNMISEAAFVKVCFGIGNGLYGEKLHNFVCHHQVAGEFLP